jgi:hypothetical protein
MAYRYMQRRLRAGAVVLGGVVYGAPNGEGWGSERPGEISNGGDAGGTLLEVHWSSWGGAVAHGTADHPIFRPNGGYYSRPVVAQLKATKLGHCEGHRAYQAPDPRAEEAGRAARPLALLVGTEDALRSVLT